MTKFSDNLSNLRKANNYSLKELSDRLNSKYNVKFSKASIDRWEKERQVLLWNTLVLYLIFRVSLDELSGRKELVVEEKPKHLAAHLDGDLTDEEWQEILDYAGYIRSKRK